MDPIRRRRNPHRSFAGFAGVSVAIVVIAATALTSAAAAVDAGSPRSARAAERAPASAPRIITMRPPGRGTRLGTGQLTYHGGNPAVLTGTHKVYLVFWGSQWNNNDPSGEAAIEQAFFSGVGGSPWNESVTQYCQGAAVAVGTTFCGSAGTHATNPSSVYAGTWYDNASAAPTVPVQGDLAAEAIRAAAHFGNTSAASNLTSQYIVNTATGNSTAGFTAHDFCAWHSSVSSVSYGLIAYTNFPYNTDEPCGANYNGLGPTAGITIVGGHEFAETETDFSPNGGWLDATPLTATSGPMENGDKCSWIPTGQGVTRNITLSTGTFAVQSLWSNLANGLTGGCVLATGAPPANDTYGGAVLMDPLPFSAAQETTTATDNGPVCAGLMSVWYRFDPLTDTTIDLTTAGTDYDVILGLYEGNSTLTQIDCIDAHYAGVPETARLAGLAGHHYVVIVGGYQRDSGHLALGVAVADTTPPDTTITGGPSGTVGSTSATFDFTATEAGSTFACALDAGAFTSCSSGQTYSSLSDGSHTFSVRATDVAGNLDPTPATTGWTVDSCTPTPVMSGPSFTTPSTMGLTKVPVRISWHDTAGCSAVSYELQGNRDGGAYGPLGLPVATATGRGIKLAPGHTYRFRVRGTHGPNLGTWWYTAPTNVSAADNSGGGMRFTGLWLASPSLAAYGGDTTWITSPGASVRYRFTGRSVAYVARRGPTNGSVRIYVDNVLKATVSLFASSVSSRPIVWASAPLAVSGPHTVKLVVVGTPGHARVDVDAFLVLR